MVQVIETWNPENKAFEIQVISKGSGHYIHLTEERIARIQAEIEVLDENIEAANDFGADCSGLLSRREYLVGVLNG